MDIQIIRMTKENSEQLFSQLLPLNRLLARAAYAFGCTVYVYVGLNMFRAEYKGKKRFFRNLTTPLNVEVSIKNADNKFVTNCLLKESRFPVANLMTLSQEEFKANTWTLGDLQFPLVVKPLDGNKGIGVVTNITTKKDLILMLKKTFKNHEVALIEEFKGGMKDYRITILDNKIIGVLLRTPAYIKGDGKYTIRELITLKNAERKKNTDIKMGAISIDDELRNNLKKLHLTLDGIPAKGKTIQLKNVCNMGSGGEVEEVTDAICSENKQLALQITKAFQLRLCGLDVLCKDIRKPITSTGGVVIEVNAQPDIGMHHFPQKGKPRDLATPIIRASFT